MSGMQYGHGGQHWGRGSKDCPAGLHHHHDERCVSPLDDRRQRAREAFHDQRTLPGPSGVPQWESRVLSALESAIETATRVQLTPEIEDAVEAATGGGTIHDYAADDMRRVLIAAFEAAGFEVEQ